MTANDPSTQRFTLPDGITVYVTPFRPEVETKRQLERAGLELTSDQQAQLQQAFSEAIANTLTPEQHQRWEQFLNDDFIQQIEQASRGEIPIQRDPVQEARDWEALKRAFRDAELPLTPEQEAQMQQIHQQFVNALEPRFRSNPIRALIELISPFFLPEAIARWIFRSTTVGNSLLSYAEEINTVLTPEQKQVWERYLSNRE